MTLRATSLLFGTALLFGGLAAPPGNAQEVSLRVKAVHVTGLAGVKDNTKGTLNIENAQLHFVHGKAGSDVSAASVQDVVTGADSRESVGKTVGMMSMAAPYGGGRFLSLFRTKIDTLTIQYRDANGGLHGAIFTMPAGAADRIKKDLVAQGGEHIASSGESARTAPTPNRERKQNSQPAKIRAAALQVAMIQSDEIQLPAEFQVALYENLIRQLEKDGFPNVYRDGDRNATAAAGLVVLHSTVRGFKAGSERARQVTTVSGATSIKVHCQFTNQEGSSLLEQDIVGKVRFFGGNLKATYDFAKKAAHVAHENFFSPQHE